VSGCSRGIGKAICYHFAKAGFNVAGYARNASALASMKEELELLYPSQQFLFMAADATKEDEINNFAAAVVNTFGTTEILVNNAGTYLTGEIMEEPSGQLAHLMDLNFFSAYHLTRALKGKISRNIFNISSIAGIDAYEGGASYTISKFAMTGFSKQLRLELKNTGIKVTCIMPGAVRTDSWNGTDLPDSRFIPAEDIAKTIYSVFELSNNSVIEEIIIRPQLGDI